MFLAGLLGAVVVLWMTEAVLLARWMGRRGHDWVTWLLLGASLGPIGVLVGRMVDLEDRARAATATFPPPGAHKGPIDVLVGFDGSRQAREALRRTVRMFGPRLGRLTVATVVDVDRGRVPAERRLAEHLVLAPVLDELEPLQRSGTEVTSAVVMGRASEELSRLAVDGRYDLLVVGAPRRALPELIVGSTVKDLLRSAPVPMLVGPVPVAGPARAPIPEADATPAVA